MSGKGESLYWIYETSLKMLESKLGYVAGANGAIYGIKSSLFVPLPKGTINDDFTISMRIVAKGHKCIYEQHAIAYEDVSPSVEGEFKRHIRDGAGHYIAMVHLINLLNPFLGIKSFIYWSHSVIRWLVPFFLIFIYLTNIFMLENSFYKIIFILQNLFYISALIGLLLLSVSSYKKINLLLYIPFYFCNLNLAILIGFFKAISGSQKSMWNRTER